MLKSIRSLHLGTLFLLSLFAVAGLAAVETPVILTPPLKPEPRINGARVFGVRPGSPFQFQIAASGERPMRFAAENLPAGLNLDEATGRITGVLREAATFRVTVRASNAKGRAQRELRIVVGEDIALTPPMGCNSYGGWGPFVTEENIRAAARALVDLGLINHGYTFVNIDDGWQGQRGGPHQAIQPNEKFGDLRKLCDDLHAMGLKVGIYSTPWTTSYEGFVGGSSDDPKGAWVRSDTPRSGIDKFGAYGFETNDARQIAEWGFDYFKYDWAMHRDTPERATRARRMHDALRQSGRDVVLEISNEAPLEQAAELTAIATMCRTTGDIVDVWDRKQLDAQKQTWAFGVRDIWNHHKLWAEFNRPGHWNMPCPLRVGMLGGWDLKPLRPTRLTPDEQYTHFTLWCMWSAPLIIGCPPERLDEFTLRLLTNDEVIDINQDPLGRQARQVEVGGHEILVKDLEDGSKAVGLFNVGSEPAEVRVAWTDLGLKGPQRVRDLWRQQDQGVQAEGFGAMVPSHGVVLIKIQAAQP